LFEKFGQHQPLNRQAERYAKEGVPLSLSTLEHIPSRRTREGIPRDHEM
jgi:transposase